MNKIISATVMLTFCHILNAGFTLNFDAGPDNNSGVAQCLSGKDEKSENLHKSFYIIREAA